LLEFGINPKASVEEVSPGHLIDGRQKPGVNERFRSQDNSCAAFERKPPQPHPPPSARRRDWALSARGFLATHLRALPIHVHKLIALSLVALEPRRSRALMRRSKRAE
jgi:hypothetical protein